MGGRRIEERGSFISSDGQGPEGVKVKQMSSVNGAGGLNQYEDTDEKIKGSQSAVVGKMNSHKPKEYYRN